MSECPQFTALVEQNRHLSIAQYLLITVDDNVFSMHKFNFSTVYVQPETKFQPKMWPEEVKKLGIPGLDRSYKYLYIVSLNLIQLEFSFIH